MSLYPRVNYEMTEEDHKRLLDASRPTPVMYGNNGVNLGGDRQANANAAWNTLGEKMHFDPMTVRPIPGKGTRFFSAVPLETEEQRTERLAAEAEAKRVHDLADIESQIRELEQKRARLLGKKMGLLEQR